MKRTWQVIEREMRREGLSAKQMAAKLGMDPAQLSRLRTGQLRDLSAETLQNLVSGLRASAELHTELLAAYLSDKLAGRRKSHAASAKKAVSGLKIEEAPEPYGAESLVGVALGAGLNQRTAEALGTLVQHARANRRLQALLISLADFFRKD